jgi:hypothetical protein
MREFLKDIFWDFPRDMFTDGLMGCIMGILYVVLLVGTLFLVSSLTLYLVDTVGVEPKPQAAVVESTRFIPAHVIIINTMVGNVSVPQVNYIPDAWEVIVTTANDGTLACPATKEQFNTAQPGQHATAWVKKGRLTGGPYCTQIQLP